MTTTTIRSSREIDAVFRASRRVAHPLVVALITSTPEGRGPTGRVAFIAGKKLGNAVARNRAKRVLRASIARLSPSWDGYDVALIARAGTGTAASDDLDRAVANVLERAGVTYAKAPARQPAPIAREDTFSRRVGRRDDA